MAATSEPASGACTALGRVPALSAACHGLHHPYRRFPILSLGKGSAPVLPFTGRESRITSHSPSTRHTLSSRNGRKLLKTKGRALFYPAQFSSPQHSAPLSIFSDLQAAACISQSPSCLAANGLQRRASSLRPAESNRYTQTIRNAPKSLKTNHRTPVYSVQISSPKNWRSIPFFSSFFPANRATRLLFAGLGLPSRRLRASENPPLFAAVARSGATSRQSLLTSSHSPLPC